VLPPVAPYSDAPRARETGGDRRDFARCPISQDQQSSALFKHASRAVVANGFLSRQTAPLAAALASSSGSASAVTMMTGTRQCPAVSACLRSNPHIPGICTSVMTQSHEISPCRAMNSSAEANSRAPYPNERSDSTSAARNCPSSSITTIVCSFDTVILSADPLIGSFRLP
jgi:hypothetical protein